MHALVYTRFPDLDHAYSVRNVRIEDLGARIKFIDLDRTLDGWRLRADGDWSVRDGVITGANGHGILYAWGVFENFELTALVRSRNRVNAGIFLRGAPDPKEHRGFEAQIYSPVDSVYPTGSIYGKQRAKISADYEERWFLMQVRVEGSRCLVRIDGETVAEYDALAGRDLKPGRIGLQIHMTNASVEFRDLRVQPL